MEGNFWPEPPHLPVVTGCGHELTRSNSDASSLTAENCKDNFRRTVNATPDECTAWTDEKHKLYIHRLEMSFIKQLHQSKCLLTQCSDQSQGDINISQIMSIDVDNAPDQFNVLGSGCWQKINWVRGVPLSGCASADPCAPLKSKWTYNFKRTGMNHEKGKISHGIATCSKEFSWNNPCSENLFDLTREGMGQNFSDADNQSTSSSKTKRLKTTLANISSPDQIEPSRECPRADYSVFNSFLSEKD